MANRSSSTLLRHIRTLASKADAERLSDRDLLRRFTAERDETAFADLVRRHGPMVLGVCRRVLRHAQDAEDVFQATFLVLAQKSSAMRWQDSVGNWLYGVAYRLALKAKVRAARRNGRGGRPLRRSPPDPLADVSVREAQAILDAELARLPEKYRAPLVLCCLEGKARDEAARQLGWPVGLVKSRLEEGRERLRRRLVRRGLTLPAALSAALLLEGTATAGVPAFLAQTTVQVARQLAADNAVAATVSANVTALVNAASKSASVIKLKTAALLFVGLCVLGAGAGVVTLRGSTTEPPEAKQAEEPKSVAKKVEPKPAETKQPRLDRYGDPLPEGAIARLGTTRLRHGAEMSSLAFSRDGRTVAGADFFHDVRLWEVTTGKEIRRFKTPRGATCIALSPDGATLASRGHDDVIRLWDTATGAERRQLRGHVDVASLAISPDGKTLAAGAGIQGVDLAIWLWDMASGRQIRQCKGHTAVIRSVVFSADGQSIASASEDRTVRLWNAATGAELRQFAGHEDKVSSVALSPDGKTLASGSQDKTLRFWDVTTGKALHRCEGHRDWIQSIAFAPDGKTLASGAGGLDGTIRIWDVSTGKQCGQLPDAGAIRSLAYSPSDGKVLASCGDDSTVRLWNVQTGKQLDQGAGSGRIWSIALSPKGKTLASVGDDAVIRLWDPDTGRELRQLRGHEHGISCVAFSPDGGTIASADNKTIRLWNKATGAPLRQFGSSADSMRALALSSDGKLAACGGRDGIVRLWDTTTGKECPPLRTKQSDVRSSTFSPDGKLVAFVNSTSVVQVWSLTSGKRLATFQGPLQGSFASLVFSPDGRRLALSGLLGPQTTVTICIWDLPTRREICQLPQRHRGEVRALAFSPDGRVLASAALGDLTVHLWEIATAQEVHIFQGHQGWINSIAFSPDGRVLYTGSRDTTVLAWDVTGRMQDGRLPATTLSSSEMEARWIDLAGVDAAKAYRAIWNLTAAPGQTVPLMKERLQPAPRGDAGRIARLIADLDGNQFAVREKAAKELEQLGEAAADACRRALEGQPSAEVRRRLEALLEKQSKSAWNPSPERLRALRALEVLEHIGSPEAQEVLKKVATGAPEARLTQEAKASLERLDRRITARGE